MKAPEVRRLPYHAPEAPKLNSRYHFYEWYNDCVARKRCTQCGIEKSVQEFRRLRDPLVLNKRCHSCNGEQRAYARALRAGREQDAKG